MITMIRTSLDNLDIEQLTEVLTSVQYQYGLSTIMETRENIEAGQYTKEEIIEAIGYKRTEGMGSYNDRMSYLPISIIRASEDYEGILY